MLLVCPHCQSVNRLPTERLKDEPRCGRCHRGVLADGPVELGAGDIDRWIGRNGLPLVVDFWAPWCGPCRAMAPVFGAAARCWRGRLLLAKVNTELEKALVARFDIRSVPTLVAYSNGIEADRRLGALAPADLDRWLESLS